MSRGNPAVCFRIDPEQWKQISAAIVQRNLHSREAPWTMTDFLKAAITEKLAHMERSRRPRSRRPKEVVYEFGG